MSSFTRPLAGTQKDYQEFAKAMDSKYSQSITEHGNFPSFFAWCGVIFCTLITAAICWGAASLVGMKADIAVLLARPLSVPRDEYSRDAQRWDQEIGEIKRQMDDRRRP